MTTTDSINDTTKYDDLYDELDEEQQFDPSLTYVIKRDGKNEVVQPGKCQSRIEYLINEEPKLNNIDSFSITKEIINRIENGIYTWKLDEFAAEYCENKSVEHPDYSILASRIIISNHHKNTSPSFSEAIQTLYDNVDENGNKYPIINNKLYDNVMKNKEKLNSYVDKHKKNDFNISYFGFKTLERAYLYRVGKTKNNPGKVIERPQYMYMRVALSIHKNDIKKALKTYKEMSEGKFIHATPTLYNMGSNLEQGSSCFLVSMNDDSIKGIFETLKNCALISKTAGGIGLHCHNIRGKGSVIRSTQGLSDGLIEMLKVFEQTSLYVNQGGRRKGSFSIYLEPSHPDIEDFIEIKQGRGDDNKKSRHLFPALWIPDLFMKRVINDEDWTLMCPDKCPGLYDKYGDEYEELYERYEKEGRGVKVIKARDLMRRICMMQIESGTPYICYKDHVNRKTNQSNLGTIKSSNLCTEIMEYSSPEETAVCNLASIALPKFVDKNNDGTFSYNFEQLETITKMITENLNNIIDYNYYPTKETETSNRRHRPIGIGVQGLADTFAIMRYPFTSNEAKILNKKIFAHIYLAALEASCEIAKKRGKYVREYKRLLNKKEKYNNQPEQNNDSKKPLTRSKSMVNNDNKQTRKRLSGKFSLEDENRLNELKTNHFIIEEELKLPSQVCGAYSSFNGSPTSNGILQYDLWKVEPLPELKERFNKVKEEIKKYGLRNSLLLAPMPTASTSQILGNNECFEAFTDNIYSRETLSGNFTVVNKYLINDLIKLGLWNDDLKNNIIANNSSIQHIESIPKEIRELYKTTWEISQKHIIDMAADRGQYIDQSQSMNIHMINPTIVKVQSLHKYAWEKGLKTGIYYLRTLAATEADKFSISAEDLQKYTVQKTDTKNNNENIDTSPKPRMACSLLNPDCEACGS